MRGHRGEPSFCRTAGQADPFCADHQWLSAIGIGQHDADAFTADADARRLAQGPVPELARKADGNRKGGGPDGLGAGRP